MSLFRLALKPLALCILVLPAPLDAALAWEAEDVAGRLKSLAAQQGTEIGWSALDSTGSSVTMQDVTVAAAGEAPVTVGTITLDDVSEDGAAYRVGELSLPHYEYSDAETTFTLDDLSITGLVLPEPDADDPMSAIILYDAFDLEGMLVEIGGNEAFTLTDLHGELTRPDGEGAYEFTGTADSFTANLTELAEDQKGMQTLKDLGYSQLGGSLVMEGSWNPADGRAKLTRYDLTVADAGTFGISVDLAGYTPEFIASMRQLQEQMAKASDEESSAQGMAMLGLLQQLSFHGVSIRFDDDSLTDKMLSYVAGEQGVTREEFANHIKSIIPLQLSKYLGSELTAETTEAVGVFLDDPQSLEIRARPENAVPFAMLMGAAMGAPQTLAKQLGVEVLANE